MVLVSEIFITTCGIDPESALEVVSEDLLINSVRTAIYSNSSFIIAHLAMFETQDSIIT